MASGIPGEVTRVKTSVSLNKELFDSLNKYTEKSMIPRSRVINEAVRRYLEREYPAFKQDKDN